MLVLGLALTGVLWQQAKTAATESIQAELQREANDITSTIERNLDANALMLMGFEGLFGASERVTHSDFRRYFQVLNSTARMPGFAGVAYVELVNGQDMQRHQAQVRRDGLPGYRVSPDGQRDSYTPIVYIEPLNDSNRRAVGFDISTVPPAQAAIAMARDTGRLTMSSKLTLKQDEGNAQPGFVMFVPIYQRDAQPASLAERRAKLVGWVDAPFRMASLIEQVLPQGLREVGLSIYDTAELTSANLMFDADGPHTGAPAGAMQFTQALFFGGRQWPLAYQAKPGFGAAAVRQRPTFVAFTGTLVSLLLSGLVALLWRAQQRREQAVLGQAAELERQAREALRAQNEHALQESLSAMNEAQRIGQVGTYVTDIQRATWQSSAVLDEILGLVPGFEKSIASWITLVAPEHRQQAQDAYQRATQGEGKLDIDFPIVRPLDGQRRWINARGDFSHDAQGQSWVLRGTVRDITQRKSVELELQSYRDDLQELVRQRTAELQNSQALLNATLNATAGGLLVLNPQETIMLWNQRFVELWHLPAALVAQPDMVPCRAHMLTQVVDPQALLALMTRLREDPFSSHKSASGVIQMADGRVLRCSVQAQKVEQATVGWVWSFVDITEFKRAELAARQANQAKSEFLANMSHEIRTPMNGVIGMVDVLQQTPLLPEQKHMLDTVANSSQTLLHILNDILDYSKIEAGQLAVERLATPLQPVCESVVQLLQNTANARGVALSLTLAPGLPAAIYTDPTRLRQVLLNLMGNAIKFTQTGPGHVPSVALSLAPGELPNGQPGLLLKVADNGIGMSEAVVAKLFTPFTQADASTARQFGGTGLGLSISQRLVALMGGQITAQSRLGEGSEFTVALPLQEAPPEPVAPEHPERRACPRPPAASVAAAQANGRLILLAEDNETNRDVMREQLRLLGYAAEMAVDGVAALAQWRSGRFGLLLTDCHMPGMDGFALTAAIRAEEAPGLRRPIIAVTANAMRGEVQNCLACGMDDYLSKPLRLQELGPMLAKWLPLANDVPSGLAAQPPQRVAPVATAAQDSGVPQPQPLPIWNAAALGLLVGDNPGLHERLLTKFLTNATGQVKVIAEAAQADAMHQAALVAHTLKSSARAVGAFSLGEVCEQLETAGLAGDMATWQALAARLEDVYAPTREAILARDQRL